MYQNVRISVDMSMIHKWWLVNWLGGYKVVDPAPLHSCLSLHINAAACLWICIDCIAMYVDYEHFQARTKLEQGSASLILKQQVSNCQGTCLDACHSTTPSQSFGVFGTPPWTNSCWGVLPAYLGPRSCPVDAWSCGDLLIATGGSAVQNANVCG